MVQLLVEDAPTELRLRPLVREQLIVPQNDLDQRDAGRFGDLELLLGPGICLVAYRLLPDGEARARSKAVAQRAGLVDLVRVAGPIQGVHQLLAEKEQIVTRALRQRNREQARADIGIARGLR